MKNTFTFRGAGVVTASNKVEAALTHWSAGKAFAAYMSVLNGEHRLDKETELVSYNDNVSRGPLYATYRITVGEGEFPYGIEEVGFSPAPGEALSNRCTLSASGGGDIYGTVYLEARTSDFVFYPGENALVKSLLGMTKYGRIEVRGTDVLLDNVPAATGGGERVSVIAYADNGLVIDFESGDKNDFTVLCDGVQSARFNLAYFTATQRKMSHASNGGFVTDAISVSEVMHAGVTATPFSSHPLVAALYPVQSDVATDFSDCKFVGDPSSNHVAIASADKFYLVSDDLTMREYDYDGELMLASDGTPVSVKDGTVQFILPERRSVNVQSGKTVVLFRDGGYDVFVYAADKLYIYRYDGTLQQKHVITVPSGGELYRLTGFVVAVCRGSERTLFTADGAADFTFEGLDAVSDERLKDGCYYGEGYMGSFLASTRKECDKQFDKFCLYGGELFYVDDKATSLGTFDADDVAQMGGYVLILSRGKLTCYAAGIYGTRVYTGTTGDAVVIEKAILAPTNRSVRLIIN